MTTITLGRKVVYSAVGGIVLTLITGLLRNISVIDVVLYGHPLPWIVGILLLVAIGSTLGMF